MSTEYNYKYEVHLHTAQGSACGTTMGQDYVEAFKEAGYDGIIVTDHFFRGNTAIDRHLPWEDFVEQFCKGYEAAKEAGDKIGLKVFFGWEECNRGDEYLVYGLDKQWLKSHPEYKCCSMKEQYRMVKESGGLVVQAHPFREAFYLRDINLHPLFCDAMEGYNFGNMDFCNAFAYKYCNDRHIIMTSGTDIHNVDRLKVTEAGMLFEKPLETIEDYVKTVKSGKGFKPLIPDRFKTVDPDMMNHVPIYTYDENEQPQETDLYKLKVKEH